MTQVIGFVTNDEEPLVARLIGWAWKSSAQRCILILKYLVDNKCAD
jgi:hypothetical protein